MTVKFKASSDGLSAQLGVNGQYPITIDANGISSGVKLSPDSLTNYINPSVEAGWRDVYRSGWLPYWFNQQWGGAQWGGLPDGSNGDVATGYIQTDGQLEVCNAVGTSVKYQPFKVCETFAPSGVWVKLYKVGNPSDNVKIQVWSDNGSGLPNSALGTAGVLSMKTITSKSDGEWYFIPVTFPILTANTQYHLVFNRDMGSPYYDASHYYLVKVSFISKFPGAANNSSNTTGYTQGYATPGATPTSFSIGSLNITLNFLIPNANKFLDSAGQFDGQIKFNQGSPVNQSKLLSQPMKNFFNGQHFTTLIRGQNWAKGSTIADFTYGIDHERLVIRCLAGTGYLSVTVYPKSATNLTPTPITITSTVDVSTGFKDIGVSGRFKNDGQDYLTAYVNGVNAATVTAQSILMSNEWRDLGTAILGGGFDIAPTWTVDEQFNYANLPSNNGWTNTALSVTEANAFSVSGGKLYQNKTGFDAGGASSYSMYSRTASPTLSNGTGWSVSFKLRTPTDPNVLNAPNNGSVSVWVYDGSKSVFMNITEYFVNIGTLATTEFVIQGDFKNQEHAFVLSGKGSDYYLHIDGKLAIDGTGKLTNSSATNNVYFGDECNASGGNSDAIWDYVKIYNGGMLLPTASTGASLSEFSYWSGDKSALLPAAYNTGTPLSIKSLCGVGKNYVGEGIVQKEVRRGVVYQPSTSSTTSSQIPDMECFTIGTSITSEFFDNVNTSTVFQVWYSDLIDGAAITEGTNGVKDTVSAAASGTYIPVKYEGAMNTFCGLHKNELKWYNGTAGTTISVYKMRRMSTTAKS